MILNFQRRFQPFILDGSKTHTIRGERKDGKRPEAGEMLHLYTGLRQKGSEFILRAPCLRTEDVVIRPSCFIGTIAVEFDLFIAGVRLNDSERDALAWRDGFRWIEVPSGAVLDKREGCFEFMMNFWDGRLPFRGWITHWDYSKAQFERRAA